MPFSNAKYPCDSNSVPYDKACMYVNISVLLSWEPINKILNVLYIQKLVNETISSHGTYFSGDRDV